MILRITRPRQKYTAQGLLEFALVLPLLLLLSFGLIEAGRLLFIYSSVMISSREGARYGAAVGDAGGYTARYTDCAGIREAAKRIGKFAGMVDGDILISYDHGPGSASAFATCPLSAGQEIKLGDRIIVQVTATYRSILPLVGFSSFPITTTSRRTIIKNVQIEGTPPSPVTPTVSFVSSEASHDENAGEVQVTLQLTAPTDKLVTVPFTVGGSAGQGPDYAISTSPVIFQPGDMLADISISIVDDPMDEDDETIVLTMGSPTNAVKGVPDVHTVTIVDNDDPPLVSFSLAGQSQTEETDAVAVITLSAPSSRDITVNFSVSGTATGGGIDYTLDTNPVVIPAGSTNYSLVIDVQDDLLDEDDETVQITLGEVVNATKAAPTEHLLMIIDNDLPPEAEFTWAGQMGTESSGTLVVEVSLSAPSSKEITVPFSVSGTATNGSDYTIDPSPFIIPAGMLTDSIEIRVKPDTDNFEGDETIILTLATPTNATLGSTIVHTVVVGDEIVVPSVSFTASGQSVDESAGTVLVSVSLSHATNQDVTVPFTIDGTTNQGSDYAIASSQFVIPAGGRDGSLEITLIDDAIDEFNETIRLTMGTPTNANKGTPDIHTITIVDNDVEPQVFFTAAGQSVPESIGRIDITVQVSVSSEKAITVPFTLGGTAVAGSGQDYTVDTPSPILIPAGSTNATISLTVIDDSEYEQGETITLTLQTPTNATIGDPESHTITILDNEPVCPFATEAPYFGTGVHSDMLFWTLQSPDPLKPVNLTEITLQWPSSSAANLIAITFGESIYAGSAPPPDFMINIPTPLWSGAFDSRQLIFKFDAVPTPVPGDSYMLTATFEGCVTISGSHPSD